MRVIEGATRRAGPSEHWFSFVTGIWTSKCLIGESGLPSTRAVSTNKNVTNHIPREKFEEWLPRPAHELSHSNREKDTWIANKTFQLSNVTHGRVDDERHPGYLQSNEANYTHLNGGIRPRTCSLAPVNTCNMVVRSKACGTVTRGVGA